MSKKYEKKILYLEKINEEYIYWKKANTRAKLFLEGYKEKLGISIDVTNFLPSYYLHVNGKENYYVVIEGTCQKGEMRKNLGNFFISPNGDGRLYKRTDDFDIDWISKVIIYTRDLNTEEEIEVIKASVDNEKEPIKSSLWEQVFDLALKGKEVQLFSEDTDETKARWYIIPFDQSLYGHIGLGIDQEGKRLVAYPGRFLKEEQPECSHGKITLWQPLKGGEEFFRKAEEMDEDLVENIYGYWIGIIGEDELIRPF